MSILIAKSHINIKAAKILIAQKLYSASVHCSYYSAVQLITYILVNCYGFKASDIRNHARNNGKGLHVFIKEFIFEKLYKIYDEQAGAVFKRQMEALKERRVRSDYRELPVDYRYCNKALMEAVEVSDILKSFIGYIKKDNNHGNHQHSGIYNSRH